MFLHGFQIHRVPYWKLWKRTRDSRFWSILHVFVDKYKILGWPKKFIWVFYNIIWKNPNELLGPPNAIVLTVLSITEKIVKGVQSWKIKDLGSERENSWKFQSHTKIQDGKGNGNPLQYFCLEMTGRNRAAQLAIVKQMSRHESRSSVTWSGPAELRD